MIKKIDVRKSKNQGIISDEVKQNIETRIKHNYTLFGDRNSSVDSVTFKLAVVDNEEGEPALAIEDIEYFSLILTEGDIKKHYPLLNESYTIQYNYLNCSKSAVSFEKKWNNYLYTFIDYYTSFVLTMEGSRISFYNRSHINEIIDEHRKIEKTAGLVDLVNIDIDHKNGLYIGIIYPVVNSAPIVLIDDKPVNVEDYTSKHFKFNSIFKKYSYTQSETIKKDEIIAPPMSYSMLYDGVMKILKNESLIEDPFVYDKQYKNSNGFNASYYEIIDKEEVHKDIYFKNDMFLKTINGKIVPTNPDAELSELSDRYAELSVAIRDIKVLLGTAYLSGSIANLDNDDVQKSYIANHDRSIQMVAFQDPDSYSFVYITLYKLNNTFITTNIVNSSEFATGNIFTLLDDKHNIIIQKLITETNSDTVNSKSIQFNNGLGLQFTLDSYKDDGYITTVYNGPEGSFSFVTKEDSITIEKFTSYNSSIFSLKSDDHIYIRDEWGVPVRYIVNKSARVVNYTI